MTVSKSLDKYVDYIKKGYPGIFEDPITVAIRDAVDGNKRLTCAVAYGGKNFLYPIPIEKKEEGLGKLLMLKKRLDDLGFKRVGVDYIISDVFPECDISHVLH